MTKQANRENTLHAFVRESAKQKIKTVRKKVTLSNGVAAALTILYSTTTPTNNAAINTEDVLQAYTAPYLETMTAILTLGLALGAYRKSHAKLRKITQ